MESASRGEAENDSSSACTQTIENGEDPGVQQCDSEEERLTSDDTNTKGASACVRPTSLNLQKHCSPSTERELSHSNQIQMSNEAASPQEPAKVVITTLSIPRGSASPQDKICCFSTDNSQRKLSSAESSPEHSGLSMNRMSSVISSNTEGACARYRPTSLNLRIKHPPRPTERDELSHPNQIAINSNTNGTSAHVRPTSLSLNLQKHCPPSTERDELSHPNQIVVNSHTKGADARVNPTSLNLNLQKHCPPPTERDELSQLNQIAMNSNTKGTSVQVRPISLSLQKHCPPSTQRDSNQTQKSNNVASAPEPAEVVKISKSIDETSGESAQAGANAANQSDSQEVDSSPVKEQVYKNVDSEESDHYPHLDSHNRTREHRQYRQASRFGPLSAIPEETLSSQCEDQTRCQLSPSYISSSECTSSVYSSARGANCGAGYLADIEDMDNTSMHSDMESDDGTEDHLNVVHKVNGGNRSECKPESIQEMVQKLTVAPRVQWYKNTNPDQPHCLLSDGSDSDIEYFYIATVPLIELPDSPSSARGYIGMLPQTVELVQDDEDTFGLEDEVMARPIEHTDTPNSGYISNNPQNEIRDDVHQYQQETTV